MKKKLNIQKRRKAKQQAYKAMLDSDWESFLNARFSDEYTFSEGNAFLVSNLDLRDVDFAGFKGNYVYFYECDMRGVNFRHHNSWPLAFEHCDMSELDMRGLKTVMHAFECDMRGIKYDEKTKLNSDKVLPSEINYCMIDDDFKEFLLNHSVKFDEKSSSIIEF